MSDSSIFGSGPALTHQQVLPAPALVRAERSVIPSDHRLHADPATTSQANRDGNGKAGQEGSGSNESKASQEASASSGSVSGSGSPMRTSATGVAALATAAQRVRLETAHLRSLQIAAQAAAESGDMQRIKGVESQVNAILSNVAGVLQGVRQILNSASEKVSSSDDSHGGSSDSAAVGESSGSSEREIQALRETNQAARDAVALARAILRILLQAHARQESGSSGNEADIVDHDIGVLERILAGLEDTGVAADSTGALVDTRA